MSTSSSRQNSRFSTLNVFKFGSSPKPPPPPPKDPYYQPNHSLASLTHTLSPETYATNPSTPMSAGYAASARSPSPSPSYAPSYAASSYASSCVMAQSTTSLSTESTSTTSSRKGFFKSFSLGKKPKTPRSQSSDLPPDQTPDCADDPSISLPWNFQHNVHVDETFVGLPPTWSASLAEMGYSEEEIAAIHVRRNQSRPTLYALRNDTDSPSSSSHSVVMRPNPRTSSLMRHDTDAMSQRSGSSYAADVSRDVSTSLDYSDVSMSEGAPSVFTTPRSLVRSPDMMSQRSISQQSYRQVTTPSPSPPAPRPGPSRIAPLSKDRPPATPTKRSYHVTNDSTSTIHSPPPAYRSPKKESALGDVVEDLVLPPAVSIPPAPLLSSNMVGEEEEVVGNDPSTRDSPLRLSTLPPRLSLHQDTLSDLSSWTESLFSMLPSTPPKGDPRATLRPRPKPAASASTSSPSPSPPRTRESRSSVIPPRSPLLPSSRQRQVPPPKPLPLHVKQERPTPSPSPSPELPSLPATSSSTASDPLWQEVYNMVRSPDSGSASPSPSPLFLSTPASTISPATSEEADHDELQVNFSHDKENRDSNMSTITVTPATIVRHISVAKRARANVIKPALPDAGPKPRNGDIDDSARSDSPASSDSNSSDASSVGISTTTSGTGSSGPHPQTSSLTDSQKWKKGALPDSQLATIPYIESSPQPSPIAGQFEDMAIITPASVRTYRECDQALQRPSIVVDDISTSAAGVEEEAPWPASSSTVSPAVPAPHSRYPSWVSTVVEPLKGFISDALDPRELFADLREIAEGESGSVYAARAVYTAAKPTYVAIKQVALLPSGLPKLVDLERELRLMRAVRHPHVLSMDNLYVDVVEDSLWIKMELMDRSLADILNLFEEGVSVTEKHITQFASDVVAALSCLQKHGIAHRDVRSDNILVDSSGVVKLADFSNAVQVSKKNPIRSDPAGVIYWQAPEMRSGSYNALKVDVWSLGATMWELAEAVPPFSDVTDPRLLGDRWPPLQEPEKYTQSFHDFLRLCSESSSSRPDPDDLLNTPFVRNANGRSAVVHLLAQCRSIEATSSRRQSTDSFGTLS